MTKFAHRLAGAATLAAIAALAGCNKPGGATTTASTSVTTTTTTTTTTVTPRVAGGQDAADAKAFVESLYAHYAKAPASADNSFDPMGKNAKDVFDQSMVDLLAKDAKLTGSDGVGFIDADWICNCQDYDKIVATVTVQSATATTAKATADFKVFDDLSHNAFDLVKENGAWRVHDVQQIGTKDPQPALRAGLEEDIARMEREKAGGKKPKHNPDEAP